MKVKGYWHDERCSTATKSGSIPFLMTIEQALSAVHFSMQ
jgi:hypothetical protein